MNKEIGKAVNLENISFLILNDNLMLTLYLMCTLTISFKDDGTAHLNPAYPTGQSTLCPCRETGWS